MASEMVERVARAIAEAGNGGQFDDETWYKEYQRDVHRVRARAAIEAMREPTEVQYNSLCQTNKIWSELNSQTVWQTYIDSALKD